MQFKLELELEFENCHNREMQCITLTQTLAKSFSSTQPKNRFAQRRCVGDLRTAKLKRKRMRGREERNSKQAIAVQIVKTSER